MVLYPLKQKHYTTQYENHTFHTAPEKYGFYSFLYPYIEPFLLSGTGKDTKTTPYKHFSVCGYIWTHLECSKYIEERGGWFKVHSNDFMDFFPKYYAKEIGNSINFSKKIIEEYSEKEFKLDKTIKNPFKYFSKDHLEIFVPHYTKIS